MTGLPRPGRCLAPGKAIALRVTKARKVTVKLAGRTVTRKGAQLSRPIVVKAPRKGAYSLTVTVTGATGTATQVTRRYRACRL